MSQATMDELRAFAAVYESMGFSAAAKRLALTTNAISLRVKKLEERLGVQLFVRSTRSVSATDEGKIFYARVESILSALDEAEQELRPARDGLQGTVRICVPGAVATRGLFERIRKLLECNPRLAIHLRVSNTPLSIAAEGLDIALNVGGLHDSAFVGRLLGNVTWVLAASPAYLQRNGHPTTPNELQSHRCLRLHSTPAQREWTLLDRRGREVTVPVGGNFEADDSRALGEATYAGLGIGIRPIGECQHAETQGLLERVLPSYRFEPLAVHALMPKGRMKLARVAACVELLRDVVKELS